jgi:hypothetical protein
VGIVINLIASIVFAMLGAGSYRYLYLPYRRRTNVLSRLSPLDFTTAPVYLCYGLIPPDDPSRHFTVAQGDLSAITLGYRVLGENYGGERVRIQNCMVTEPRLNEVSNLLSISGPRWNSITERYTRTLGSPLRFSDDRKALIFVNRTAHVRFFSIHTGHQATLRFATAWSLVELCVVAVANRTYSSAPEVTVSPPMDA